MNWRTTNSSRLEADGHERKKIHLGALLLGSAAYVALPNEKDESETNLAIDVESGVFATRILDQGRKIRLVFDPVALTLHLEREAAILEVFPLVGRDLKECVHWIGSRLSAILQRRVIMTLREYPDFPNSPWRRGEVFDVGRTGEREELVTWFRNAAEILGAFVSELREATPPRLWPHHFDHGALLVVDGREDAMVGLGFSPGDEHFSSPYFYCSPFPRPEECITLPEVANGFWNRDGFVSAILTAELIERSVNPETAVMEYLESAIQVCRYLVSRSTGQ